MMLKRTMFAVAMAAVGTAASAVHPSVAAMKWERRVLIVSSPDASDPKISRQRRILAEWREGAADRDISLVEILGSKVVGASDTAAALRGHFRVNRKRFQATLIGKDGQVALRSETPIDAQELGSTIDSMPMRRNGQR